MPQPGAFRFPNAEDALIRRIQDLERTVQQNAAANPWGPMGIKPQMGGMVVEGYQTVNGPMTITGSLDLPAGSVPNTALATPVETATASAQISNYAIDTVATIRANVSLSVPAGFTRAIVLAVATASGTNSGTTSDYLYCSAAVAGVNGGELYTSAPAGIGASLSSPYQPTLTGLTSGQTITVGVATRAGTATWTAATANQCSIAATAIFLK